MTFDVPCSGMFLEELRTALGKQTAVTSNDFQSLFQEAQVWAPGWLSGLSVRLDFGSGHDLRVMGSSPALGSSLSAESA